MHVRNGRSSSSQSLGKGGLFGGEGGKAHAGVWASVSQGDSCLQLFAHRKELRLGVSEESFHNRRKESAPQDKDAIVYKVLLPPLLDLPVNS